MSEHAHLCWMDLAIEMVDIHSSNNVPLTNWIGRGSSSITRSASRMRLCEGRRCHCAGKESYQRAQKCALHGHAGDPHVLKHHHHRQHDMPSWKPSMLLFPIRSLLHQIVAVLSYSLKRHYTSPSSPASCAPQPFVKLGSKRCISDVAMIVSGVVGVFWGSIRGGQPDT